MLNCELHDYIEIACLYGFEIKLELRNGDIVQGIAKTTETSADKRELLVLDIKSQNQKFDLSNILSMEAITINSHFNKIVF